MAFSILSARMLLRYALCFTRLFWRKDFVNRRNFH